ncbi:MAG: hypothetical protein R3293_19100 [Candidatus Promineifilaceae bacterium]|nr:hypothetical protein [Candidatus Promineifilaceae bacterium]
MSNKLAKTIVMGLVVVLVMSLGVAAVFAQDDTTPSTPAKPALPFGHGRGRGGANDEALAEALGITVEELEAARQQVAVERIAQAVEEDLLTQDQANTMLAMMALKDYIDREAIMAEVLGLSIDEFSAAREDGTLRELLSNIAPAELEASMRAATEEAISDAVADNVITQEQADLVLEQIENGLGQHRRFGGHRDFGGVGRGFGQDLSGRFAPLDGGIEAPAFDA